MENSTNLGAFFTVQVLHCQTTGGHPNNIYMHVPLEYSEYVDQPMHACLLFEHLLNNGDGKTTM